MALGERIDYKGKMKTYRVGLVNFGERLPRDFSLDTLSKKLNSLQTSFTFEVVKPIPVEVLSGPDLGGQWYYFERLFSILQKHPDFSDYDYFVGITHVRITESEDSEDDGNRDYFSLSDKNKVTVVTLNRNITDHNSKIKDVYQFLSFSIIGELLCNITKEYLYHNEIRYCLFDECIDRPNVAQAIENSIICPKCLNLLKTQGISDQVLNDIYKVLDWCRSNTGKYSPLYRSIVHPLTSLSIGTAIGWSASAFLNPKQYLYIIIGAIIVPISLLIFHVKRDKKKLKKYLF
jgi:hypothetical protein